MSLRVKLHPAERFLNWFPNHTKLYIRGQRGKDWDESRALDRELFDQLVPFLEVLRHEARIEACERLLASPFDKGETMKQLVQELEEDEQGKMALAKERMNGNSR